LAAGEPAVVLDSGQPAELVLGDGVTAMADLRRAVWGDDARLAAADTAVQPADLDDVIDGTTPLPYVRAATLNLPAPAYIAHRGGAGVAPEETMEAFRTAAANGADMLEMDCQPLGDGALALVHDSTVDRTTDGTGPVSGFTAPAWRALNAAADFPWGGRVVPPALFSEVVAEFGGKAPLMVEPKDASNAGQIMDACDRAGIAGSVVISTSVLSVLQAATARGYASYFWWGAAVDTGVSVAAAVAEGATYLGLDGVARPDAEVTTLVATGLPVYPFTINRRLRAAQLLALGASGFVTDQPAYLRGTTAQRTVDSWRQGVLGHGINTNGTATAPAIVTGGLQLPAASANTVTVGEVSPLANAAGSYTIDLDIGWSTLPASGSTTTAVIFGAADDGNYAYSGAANSATGCYEAYLRSSGSISLYRLPPGNTSGAVLLGTTQATNALVAGALAHIRITVTPTTVRLQRTDGVTSDTGAVADTTYRGGYVLLGKVGGADGVARFQNLTIT